MLQMRTYLRAKRLNKHGEAILNFIVSPGDHWVTTGIAMASAYWDSLSETISKRHPDYFRVNSLYQLYKSRAMQCISNYKFKNTAFDKKYFEQYIFKGKEQTENPYFFM